MKVSFTGTRQGMSEWQKQQLDMWAWTNRNKLVQFSHGCCIGADVEAHLIIRKRCENNVFISVFPSTAKTRAEVPADANYIALAKPPLERDKDIVDAGHDLLIAAPLLMKDFSRSGTWATVRYARKKKVPVLILWRD